MWKYKTVPRFSKVCFCMPLRGGVIFLVYFNVILSAVATFVFGSFDLTKILYRMFYMSKEEWIVKSRRTKMIPGIIFIILLICLLAELGMSISALISLHRDKVKLLKIYMHYAVGIAFFILFFRMFDVGVYWYIEVPATSFYIVFKCYFILAVRSQVKKMETVTTEEIEELEIELTSAEGDNEEYNEVDPQSILNDELRDIIKNTTNELIC